MSWLMNCFGLSGPHTEVSELILSENLLELGSMISSETSKCGSRCTVHSRDTSPCLSWKVQPSVRSRYSERSDTSDQRWRSRSSRSF